MLNITTPPAARAYLAATLIAVCVAQVSAAPSLLRRAATTANAPSSISEYDYVPPGNYSGMTAGLGVSGVDEGESSSQQNASRHIHDLEQCT